MAYKKEIEVKHPSGITPFEFKVLVCQDTQQEKTKGGIIIPEPSREDQQRSIMKGKIEALSAVAFSYAEWPAGTRLPKVGDRVLFARYAGTEIEGKDGVMYRLVNDKDIGAVIDF